MGKSVRSEQPLSAEDLLNSSAIKDPVKPLAYDSTQYGKGVNPDDYEYVHNASPYADQKGLNATNAGNQPLIDKFNRSLTQFGVNAVSSFGQGLANTFDLLSTAHTLKAAVTGENDDFNSSLFGLSSRDMQNWAEGIAKRNQIYERNEGSFDPTDSGWWAKQIASSGTGVGMGLEALGTTALFEAATGGLGVAGAIGKLGQLGQRIMSGAKGAEVLQEAISTAKGMRSAATVYGILSRASESRMEAMQDYQDIYTELSQQKDKTGAPKFTEEQKQSLASSGARRDYAWNMALMPLDILSYRTMIFNPISGSGEGLIERGLMKIKNKALQTAAKWGTEMSLEGAEEGFQYVGQEEGKHYARVLGGQDDGSSFLQRFGKDVTDDEFWNNFSGGVLGSPIIGGVMGLVHGRTQARQAKAMNEVHQNFIQNIGKMDSAMAKDIKDLEDSGQTELADIKRRQFTALKSLSALHLDAMTDKETAFDAHKTFIQGVIGELSGGKTDAISDLGYDASKFTPEQITKLKNNFEDYLQDAHKMEHIYSEVKDKYNRNFVPQITYDHFQLAGLVDQKAKLDTELQTAKSNLLHYDQLSDTGKQIHDTNYTLQSLQYELERLNEEHSKSEDSYEKQDLANQADAVKAKIETQSNKLEEIQKADTYDKETRNTDNDILNSALTSKDYLQKTYEKERVDNEIAIKRKELARWNNKEYLEHRVQESIKKAKTQAQIDATKQDLNKNGKNTEATQSAIENKESELAANQAANTIQAQKQSNEKTQGIPGDSNLFADDEANSTIDGITQLTNMIDPKHAGHVVAVNQPGSPPTSARLEGGDFNEQNYQQAVESGDAVLFDPAEYDFKNSSDQAKQALKDGVFKLLGKLSNNPSFEDLVRYVAKAKGNDAAENIFNALSYGWEANGMQAVDYKAVYDKLFGDGVEQIFGAVNQLKTLDQQQKEAQEETDGRLEQVAAEEAGPVAFTPDNQPVYQNQLEDNQQKVVQYNGRVTHEQQAKFAFKTRESELLLSTNEDGTTEVDQEYTSNELNTSQHIDSKPLLDPDKWTAGTEAEIRVPTNFMDILIPVYNADGTKGKAKTFGQYVAEKGLSPDSQEYKDKIPMIIYRKGAPSTEKGVAFVHDTGWYHPIRFNQEHPDDMKNAIANTRSVRDGVLNSGDKAPIVVTGKRETTFEGLKTKKLNDGSGKYELLTLREANPQTRLTAAVNADSVEVAKGVPFENNDRTILGKRKPFAVGQVYEVRRYGTQDGKQTHQAFPVIAPKIDTEAKQSVLSAIQLYANNGQNSLTEEQKATVKNIYDTMGVDILSPSGLEEYLKHFINISNVKVKTGQGDNLTQKVAEAAKAQLAEGTPYIVIEKGQVIFGQAGRKVQGGGDAYFINIKAKSDFVNKSLSNLSAPVTINTQKYASFLDWFQQNLSLDRLSLNKPVVTIDDKFGTKTAANNYNDYLLDRYKTNVKSINIGTEEKPNYVTNIQPVITYDLASNFKNEQEQKQQKETKERAEETSKATIENISKEQEGNKNTDTNKLAEELLKRSSRFISQDDSSDVMYDPEELTEEQRNKVSEDIERIGNLTPDQQFTVVNFMYNQIVPMVNQSGGKITKAEADKSVEKAYNDSIDGYKKNLAEEIDFQEKLLAEHPELQNSGVPKALAILKAKLSKIASVENNMDTIKSLAFDRVAKYTGINVDNEKTKELTQDDLDNLSNNPTLDEGDGTENDVDFWTDILTESPENRLSYEMRRFFGQIRAVDKKGNPAIGFLDLPIYMDSSMISAALMSQLADVKSDFNTMMDKLKKANGIPWIGEVVKKLETATEQQKQQFVTVMSNHSLRMKFSMISYNNKSGTWKTKIYDTNKSGTVNALLSQWKDNMMMSDIVSVDPETHEYVLNIAKAENLIRRFNEWKGANLKQVQSPLSDAIVKNIKQAERRDVNGKWEYKSSTFTATNELLQELNTNLVSSNDRMTVKINNTQYQIGRLGDGKFKVDLLKEVNNNQKEIENWLGELGIELSPGAMDELMNKGLFHNYAQRKFDELFQSGNSNGLFGILTRKLEGLVAKGGTILDEEGNSPLEDSVIKSLAALEAKYNDKVVPFSFRDGKKTIYGFTAPKFITDRVRDLKSDDETVRKELNSVSFSKGAFWLRLLNTPKFREKFNVAHIGLTAFKELGKKVYRDNSITKLSDLDHELTKLGMFWDMSQGDVSFTEDEKTFSVYPDSKVGMRMGTVFSPTMSDKSMMSLITTAVLNLRNAELNDGKGITDDVKKIIYNEVVRPELLRMINHAKLGGETNIEKYDKGAQMFLFMPNLNNLEYTQGLKLVDAIKNRPDTFSLKEIEDNNDLKDKIYDEINKYVETLTDKKIEAWKKSGLAKEENGQLKMQIIDGTYKDKLRGSTGEITRMAAMDFVINNMIANANSFMTMAGDPALYFKSKAKDPLEAAKETFINVGKRLAAQIAPGTTLANSEGDKYIQLFLADTETVAGNIDYLEKILGKEGAKAYRKIEATDAQEYTTWKEHLDVLSKLGKIGDDQVDVTPEEIEEARALFTSGTQKLTDKQKELIKKVAQPMKPVYTGQVYDPTQDVMRTVYIKSSSFPLIPQLTAGLEIDKLRQKMQDLQDNRDMNVRASYQSANKVGAVTNPAEIWDKDGNIDEDELNKQVSGDKDGSWDDGDMMASTLILDRKNFRIQQEVPFKTGKNTEDKITLGTQVMKLLFGDGMMNFSGFKLNGKEYTGKQLHEEYNKLFDDLAEEKRQQLYTELGLDKNGFPVDQKKAMAKLQSILMREAKDRGYPLQDIKGLTIDAASGQFNLPLWSSANSNRYESMLNAIVGNRLIKMKFPGNSYIAGSEEGFKKSDDLSSVDKSQIIYTSAWDGAKGLQGTREEDGTLKKAQVMVASKFRDSNGKLVDLFQGTGDDRKYVKKDENGAWKLKEDMFSKELLELTSFRIPTSGHQSAAQIEVVGFLPHISGDLMIVPRGFTKQKGLDFDIDKENTYQLWHHMTDDGKFEVLSEDHRNDILFKADKELREGKVKKLLEQLKTANPNEKKKLISDLRTELATNKLFNSTFENGVNYDEEDIEGEKGLEKIASKLKEKLMQNEIIKIHRSILTNPSDEVQAKIHRVLSTDYAEKEADYIEKLQSDKEDNTYWTPLSDEYQKSKMALGASGKIGTGAYSLDVVGHSLFQQSSINGKPVELMTIDEEEKPVPKTWVFGKLESYSKLGAIKTVDGSRSISEMLAERQNIAVDNEKLQVMGRVGLDDATLDVDKVFTLTGLDKGEDGHSIAFLFLSQPIIKDYVAMMKNLSSTANRDYVADKEAYIKETLINKYGGTTEDAGITGESFTNTAMGKELTNPSASFQKAILDRFLDMKKYGIAIRGIQTTINVDSKGLGKSFFDVIEKRNALNRMGIKGDMIHGASNLIGDYEDKENVDTEAKRDDLIKKGYFDMGDFFVKPTTLSGSFAIKGISTAYNLWNRYFPYDAAVMKKAFSEIISIIGKDDMSDSKAVELKQQIFQGFKRYVAASKTTGIIKTGDDINNERARLFVDSKDNISIAKYLKSLMQMQDNTEVNTFLKTNKLLNRFEYEIEKNGQPSLIKYNNAAGEEFDEQYLYESLASLIEVRGPNGKIKLPQYDKEGNKISNKEYTLDTLAQDLIAYSYLGNAVQEAIQFTKYIPISYLNVVGYAQTMREKTTQLYGNASTIGNRIYSGDPKGDNVTSVSELTMQFIQHNPERVAAPWKYSNQKDLDKDTIKIDDNNFILKSTTNRPSFISVYDSSIPKGEKKFKLYWFDGGKYTRIPTLGAFGMDEYQPREGIGKSLVNGRVRITAEPQAEIKGDLPKEIKGTFNIGEGSIKDVLTAIAQSGTTPFTEIARKLSEIVPSDYKLEVDDTIKSRGVIDPDNKTIKIASRLLANPNDAATTFVHELVHALTVIQIRKYIVNPEKMGVGSMNTIELKSDAPKYVEDLVELYNKLKRNADQSKLQKAIDDFRQHGALTTTQKSESYGFFDIYEFMAMAVTHKGFQEELSKIPYKQGQSFLDRFKEIVVNLLKGVGLNFDENFTAAHAISNIFQFIEAENKTTNSSSDYIWDGAMDYSEDFPTDNLDEFLDEDKGLDVNNFPTKNFDIITEKCI